MLKPEKETLAQVLAKHGHVIACPSCGTYLLINGRCRLGRDRGGLQPA